MPHVSWYRRKDYKHIRSIMDDGSKFPKTFDEWERKAKRRLASAAAAGVPIQRVILDPGEFLTYCKAKNSDHGVAGHVAQVGASPGLGPTIVTVLPSPPLLSTLALVLSPSRDDVEAGDISDVLTTLRKLLIPEIANRTKGRLFFSILGYDDDPRDLWEFPQVCAWMKALDRDFPYWFYFMDLGPRSLRPFGAARWFLLCRGRA